MKTDEASPRPWRAVDYDKCPGLADVFDASGSPSGLVAGELKPADAALIVDAVNEHDRLCGIVLALCDEVEAMDDSDAVVLTDRAARIQNLIAEAREILGAGETPTGKGVWV